ncbi:MAG TPA: hypothetical protein VFB97_00890 [Bacteroidales bacterium]|nr:hypothetical protein [Bacteroidales bacterium]
MKGNPFAFRSGAGERGTGLVCITKSGFWSSFSSQSLLAYNSSFSAGVNYENRFGIPELGTCAAGVIFPAGKSSIGVIYSNFGYPEFRRNMGGISCGMPLGKNVSAGVQVDYFSEIVPGEYDKIRILTFEAGAAFNLSEKVTAVIHLFNPVPNSIRKSSLPSTLTAGTGINLSETLFAGAEVEMSTNENLCVRTGFEYEAAKRFWIRGGFSTENSSFSFGLGYLLKSMKIDLSFSTHERLGVTSSVSLVFKIK